jgi:hypothetical protein
MVVRVLRSRLYYNYVFCQYKKEIVKIYFFEDYYLKYSTAIWIFEFMTSERIKWNCLLQNPATLASSE